MSRLNKALLVHMAIALAPLVTRHVPTSAPALLALASITLAQLLLLATFLGVTSVVTFRKKLAIAVYIIAFLAIWPALALHSWQGKEIASLGSTYLYFCGLASAFVAVLSLILACASRFTGRIGVLSIENRDSDNPWQLQFSLSALLVLTTLSAIIISLTWSARTSPNDGAISGIADDALAAILLALNSVVAVWATLGRGNIPVRVAGLVIVSVGMGLVFGISQSFDDLSLSLFALCICAMLLPTGIFAVTLLSIRADGYRLMDELESCSARKGLGPATRDGS